MAASKRIDWEYQVFSKAPNIGDEFFCSSRRFPATKLYPTVAKRNVRKSERYETTKVEGGIIVRRVS